MNKETKETLIEIGGLNVKLMEKFLFSSCPLKMQTLPKRTKK
jgi:hypothetical protein